MLQLHDLSERGRAALNQWVQAVGGRARAADIAKMPASTLAGICNGQRGMSPERAVAMSNVSGVGEIPSLGAHELVWIVARK